MYKITFKNVLAADVYHVFEPAAYSNEKQKYKMKVLMNKNDHQCDYLKKVLLAAAYEKFTSPLPKGFIFPVHDSDEEKISYPYERNTRYFWAKNNNPPTVIDDHGNAVTGQSGKLHQGSLVDVDLTFNAFDWKDRKDGPLAGVTVYLNKVTVHDDVEDGQSGRRNTHSEQHSVHSYRNDPRYNCKRTGDDEIPDYFPPQPGDDDFDYDSFDG